MRRPRATTPAPVPVRPFLPRRRRPRRARRLALLAVLFLAAASACDVLGPEWTPEPGGCEGEPGLGGAWVGALGPHALRLDLTQRCDTLMGFMLLDYAWRIEGTWRWGQLDGTVLFRSTAHSALDFRGCEAIEDACALILGGERWHDRYVPGPEVWAWNSPVELRAVVRSGSRLSGFARGSWIPASDTTVVHGLFPGTPFGLSRP